MSEHIIICPHCGKEARIEVGYGGTAFRVSCKSIFECGATQHWFDSDAEAVEAWNRRIKFKSTVPKKEVDLCGKCGSCESSIYEPERFGGSSCYVRCTNPEHLKRIERYRNGLAAVRQRTTKGCKHYKMREEYAEQI